MPADHSNSATVELAAYWLAENTAETGQKLLIPMLRDRFGLSPIEATEAAKLANDLKEKAPQA